MLSLKQFLIATAQKLKNLDDNKIDMTDSELNINTSAGSGTTDGDLYTAIDALGWTAVISNQLMNLKELLTKLVDSTRCLPSWFKWNDRRVTSANIPSDNSASVKQFLATSNMTTGKPKYDGNILHFSWDSSNTYATELAILHGTSGLQYRGQLQSGSWNNWMDIYGDYTPYTTLSTAYVQNSYVLETSFNRIGAYRWGRFLIIQGNLMIDSAIPKSSAAILIGRILNVNGMQFTLGTQVPCGLGGSVSVQIVQDGNNAKIELYNYSDTGARGWSRFNLIGIVSVL